MTSQHLINPINERTDPSTKPKEIPTLIDAGSTPDCKKEIDTIGKIINSPANAIFSLAIHFSYFYYNLKLVIIPLNTSFPVSQIHLATAGQGIRVKTTCGFSFCSHTFVSLKEKLNSSPQVFIFFGVLV